jgi:hypothetical protein
MSGQKGRLTPQSKREFNGVPPLSPSSAISRNINAWAAFTSPTSAATPPAPYSPPPAMGKKQVNEISGAPPDRKLSSLFNWKLFRLCERRR